MSEDRFTKLFVITSQQIPDDLFCFEEVIHSDNDTSSRIVDGFAHQVFEVDSFDDISSVTIDENTAFVIFRKGDGNGLYEDCSEYDYGLIAPVYTQNWTYCMVRPNGDYIAIPQEDTALRHAFPPEKFGLKPYPIWKQPLRNNLTERVGLKV